MLDNFKDKTVLTHYKDGVSYQQSMQFPSKWAECERFYIGDQWPAATEKTKSLPRPVFNICSFITDHKRASVLSESLKMLFTPDEFSSNTDDENLLLAKEGADLFTQYSESCWEKVNLDKLNEEVMASASSIGTGFAHFYWDSSAKGGIATPYVGEIAGEFIDPSNIFFGNPQVVDIQKQPYIVIASRELIKNIKTEATSNGVPDVLVETISEDKDLTNNIYDSEKKEVQGTKKAIVLTEYYFKNGTVHFKKTCNDIVICAEKDTSLRKYPIARMCWKNRKNCIYGVGDIEGIIPNQKAINFMLAMQLLSCQNHSWPKLLVKPGALKSNITNTPGEIITDYSMQGDGIKPLKTEAFSPISMSLLDKVVSLTKEFSNANDSALGISPGSDTSAQAIMLLQKNSSVSLQGIKDRFYRYIEDIGAIWIEFYCTKFNMPRPVLVRDNKNNVYSESLLGVKYREFPYSVKVDVGASSNYSEIAQQATLDRLFESGAIDVVMYVKYSSDNSVPHKDSLLRELVEKQQMEQMAMGMGIEPPIDNGGGLPPIPNMETGKIGVGGDPVLGINPVYEPTLNYMKPSKDVSELLPGLK